MEIGFLTFLSAPVLTSTIEFRLYAADDPRLMSHPEKAIAYPTPNHIVKADTKTKEEL